jgi:hypothetical protein
MDKERYWTKRSIVEVLKREEEQTTLKMDLTGENLGTRAEQLRLHFRAGN